MLSRFLQELHVLVGAEAKQKRYLVAVSGGADSMVAVTLFHEAGLNFAMAHCNFHLRGADSDRDMRFVQQTAARWQVPLFIREFDTLEIQKNSGKSVEMVARDLRYAWFSEILADFDHLVTAHHATDAAETMLLNLTRGTGFKGLCGIPPVNGKIIRPMLNFTAQEIRQYAENHHIEYVEDCTNHDEQIARNRIRHSVIPQLETLNPQFLQTNVRTRSLLQRQYAYFQKHIRSDIEKVLTENEGQYRVNLALLNANQDKELILYEILTRFGFAADVSETLSEDTVLQSGKQFFSDTHVLLVDRDDLIIQAQNVENGPVAEIASMEDLRHFFVVEEFEYQKDMIFEKNPDMLYVPKDKLTFPLRLRSWRQGDYFYPLGAKGRQKISDFFTDHKIDRFAKEKVRLLCAGDQIIWIIGWRSDERFKVQKDSTICYKLYKKDDLTQNN
jgi:tRNA(Ile)-lysidine synthase